MTKPEPIFETPLPEGAVLRAVERAIGELRRGDPILLSGDGAGGQSRGEAGLVLAAEAVGEAALARMAEAGGAGGGVGPCLLMTGRRAAALGLGPKDRAGPAGPSVVALEAAGLASAALAALADPGQGEAPPLPPLLAEAPALGAAAIEIVRLARLLPAAVLVPLPRQAGPADPTAWAAARDFLSVAEADIAAYRFAGAGALSRIVEARLPLAQAEDTRVIAFRPGDGGKPHMALVIGAPKPDGGALVRVHSECFTGDLLGSLRCDCGDQLRGAVAAIAAAGAGVLLYLSQEGRGIGLVNKLRAYGVQDEGADTAQANEALGFDADERVYLPAARMLQHLGLRRVRLLTNNPGKVAALTRCGITVEERVPHAFPANGHNDFYLATKAARFGHQF